MHLSQPRSSMAKATQSMPEDAEKTRAVNSTTVATSFLDVFIPVTFAFWVVLAMMLLTANEVCAITQLQDEPGCNLVSSLFVKDLDLRVTEHGHLGPAAYQIFFIGS